MLLIAALCITATSVFAQSVDEIIQKYTANMGGLDAFKKVTSVKFSGTVVTQGNDLPVTTQVINDKAMRMDVEAMGQTVTNVYHNGKAWKINPFTGATTATEVTGTELNDFKIQASLANPLMDYKARENKAELVGQEDVEGIKTYKIKLTSKDDGRISTFFISANDLTLVKSVSTRKVQGQDMEIETFYSDIKDINGLKFFMTRTLKISGQEFQTIKLDKIELNVAIDEKIFEMPK